MSVMLETSLGDVVIDLFWQKCPQACLNFIKLCKIKFYNGARVVDLIQFHIAKISGTDRKPTTVFE